MAKREWLIPAEEGGSEEAERYAAALGLVAGGQITRLMTELIVMLTRQGGQAYIAAVRAKVDPDGFPVAEKEPGEWVLEGFHVSYENRDLRLTVLQPPPDVIEQERPRPVEEPEEA